MNFAIGDEVEWRSQSAGYYSTKRGVVVYILAAYEEPCEAWRNCKSSGRFVYGGGIRRRHVSYFVKVGNKVYWPVASLLRAVQK